MRILYCSGAGEPPYSANVSLHASLVAAGHDVFWIGPGYNGISRSDHDIEDRPHPEYYTYAEVLALAPWKPDLVLTVEPHFYLHGEKPNGIVSSYYVLDPHRGASTHASILKTGGYDMVFLTQWSFAPLFKSDAYRLRYLPQAFDATRFTKGAFGHWPICDISFIGEHGMNIPDIPHGDWITTFGDLPNDHTRFKFHESLTFDYAARGELLRRLCNDYRVRIYGKEYGSRFVDALQSGMLGFHCSLGGDMTLRPFELMAAGRAAVIDLNQEVQFAIPGQEDVPIPALGYLFHYTPYNFHPWLPNFSVYYDSVRRIIDYALNEHSVRDDIVTRAMEYVWTNHTWDSRAEAIGNYMRW